VEPRDTVIVFGRGEYLIGSAAAASEGTIAGGDLSARPLLRTAELLEAVPGMIAAQHSGSGKANQYFLRGFNLDHGTDFTTYVDDVPLNLRSHGHGQGYLDVNGLIPETVARIDYRKGPYRADVGDFALAGAAMMKTVDRFERPFLSAEAGSYGWQRLVGGLSAGFADGELLLAGQLRAYDGPWQQPEDLRHVSALLKYSRETAAGRLTASLSSYSASWRPTEQLPERAIGTPACADAYCSLDPSATGQTLRHIVSVGLQGDDWRGSAYVQFYDWNMYSNPTYDFQIRQWDRRWTMGGRLERSLELAPSLLLTAGLETRHDDVGKVQVDHTEQRRFLDFISAHAVTESSVSAYSELTWQIRERVRLMGGLRADHYRFDAEATQPAFGSGALSAARGSPKLGAAWTVSQSVEVYGNWGRGFHSNDARGVAATRPAVAGLVPGTGQELGLRYQTGSLSLTATYWWLEVDSELRFVGDSNSVEPGNASRRRGYELVGFWRPMTWLAFDLSWTGSRSRYVDAAGADRIPGAIENAGEFGVAALRGRWELSARLRHLGPYALVEDGSERARAQDTVNLRAAWNTGSLTVYGELLNALDGDAKDIVYLYEAAVPGVEAASLDRVSRIQEPLTLRAGLRWQF
jgi:outer membrane receptor protein involved in Fe transport